MVYGPTFFTLILIDVSKWYGFNYNFRLLQYDAGLDSISLVYLG